jgi:glyoxylase-like metal-dependent hydrolase (beta-lactamase superfamily II)
MNKIHLAAAALAASLAQLGCSQFAKQEDSAAPPGANERTVSAPPPAAPAAPVTSTTAPSPAPSAATTAQKPERAPYQTTRVAGTDNVYVFRYAGVQSMFVVTSAGVIATDPLSYAHREAAAIYLAEIRKITKQPVKYVIYSHHHYDHVAGGKPFKDAGAKFVSHARAKERLAALKDPNTVLPDETFTKDRTIKLGKTTLELHYIGLNHSDSTIVMRLPKEKIIFAVDVVPIGSLSGRTWIDSYPLSWETSLKRVLAMDWKWMIPGHPGVPNGRLGTKEDVQNYLGFMQEASAEVKKAARAGQCWDPAEKALKVPAKYAGVSGADVAWPFIVRRYCELWGRGT